MRVSFRQVTVSAIGITAGLSTTPLLCLIENQVYEMEGISALDIKELEFHEMIKAPSKI